MDLIKLLLLRLEASESLSEVNGYSPSEVAYHAALLEEAGLVTQEWHVNIEITDNLVTGTRMTRAGHEFLDASRNNTRWERAKAIALEKTGSLSFEVLKSVLLQLSKEAVSGVSAAF